MSKLRIVDLTWSPERIRHFCENTDNWILLLDSSMTAADLETLYRRQLTVAAPYAGVIAEIAGDVRTPEWVLEDVVTRFADSTEILSSLATNRAVPEALLAQLEQHEESIIREHAEHTRRAVRECGPEASE